MILSQDDDVFSSKSIENVVSFFTVLAMKGPGSEKRMTVALVGGPSSLSPSGSLEKGKPQQPDAAVTPHRTRPSLLQHRPTSARPTNRRNSSRNFYPSSTRSFATSNLESTENDLGNHQSSDSQEDTTTRSVPAPPTVRDRPTLGRQSSGRVSELRREMSKSNIASASDDDESLFPASKAHRLRSPLPLTSPRRVKSLPKSPSQLSAKTKRKRVQSNKTRRADDVAPNAGSNNIEWRRNTANHPLDTKNIHEDAGEEMGIKKDANTSTTPRPPKRGGSMRKILRNKRRLEQELHKSDIFHYVLHKEAIKANKDNAGAAEGTLEETNPSPTIVSPQNSASEKSDKSRLRMEFDRFMEMKKRSEKTANEATAVIDKEDVSILHSAKIGDESIHSTTNHAPVVDYEKTNSSPLSPVTLPEQRKTVLMTLILDDELAMASFNGTGEDTLSQVEHLHVQDESGTSGSYTGAAIHDSKLPHGRGTLHYKDGALFDGTFALGAKLHGTMRYTDGSAYVGEFSRGQRHGHGEYTFTSGIHYRGNFENDTIHGSGCLSWPNGSMFVGYWKGGLTHGPGKKFMPDGRLDKEGVWNEGRLIEF